MNAVYSLGRISLLLLFGISLWSCGSDTVSSDTDTTGVITIVSEFATGSEPVAQPTPIEYTLYVFHADRTAQIYELESVMAPFVEGSPLDIPRPELEINDYRFLFTAQPEGNTPFKILDRTTNSAPIIGAKWEDLRVVAGDSVTLDCYYGVREMTGTQIIGQKRVRAILNRIAGQMVFDFYKTSGGIDDAIGIDDQQVNSVLDRVDRIEIAYTGMTDTLTFAPDQQGSQILIAEAANSSATQIIEPLLENRRIAADQQGSGIVTDHAGIPGKARVMGLTMFPSDNGVRIVMTMRYFDTTQQCEMHAHSDDCYISIEPLCGINHRHTEECYRSDEYICGFDYDHAHTDDCYIKRELPLYLPANNAATGLSVLSNSYTVSKAAIRMNRVIDVPRTGGITINTDFE